MAELAAGAVSSLLGVLKNEAQLLRRMGHEVEFIKEEMESMNSFLEHLARTAPPAGSHNEQVRTWMKQVRDLAHDCSNCIDNYLQRGDPAIHRARGRLRGYVWWAYWLVQKWFAQREAAIRLRELKERASDVGKRRLTYGVEIPAKPSAGTPTSSTLMPSSSSSSQVVAALPAREDDEEDEDGQYQAAAVVDSSYYRQQALEPPTLDDYFLMKIVNWAEKTNRARESIQSIAIIVPSGDAEDNASSIVSEGLTKARAQFKHTVWINLSQVHYSSDKLGPNKVLCYILLACELQKEHKDENYVQKEDFRYNAWMQRRMVKREIWVEFNEHVEGKIVELETRVNNMESKINFKTGGGNKTRETGPINKNEATGGANGITEKTEGSNTTQDTGGSNKNEAREEGNKTAYIESSLVQTDKPLGILYLALLSEEERKEAKDVLASGEQNIMVKTAEKLKEHMETGDPHPICVHPMQYEGILRDLFLTRNRPEAQEANTATSSRAPAATSLDDERSKEIIDQIKGIIRMVRQDILEEIQSTKHQLGHDQIASAIQDTINKITQIKLKIKEQMLIKVIVEKIDTFLKNEDTLIVLEDENRAHEPKWEDIMNALKLLKCSKGSAIIVTTKDSQMAKEFCYPPVEPITYSLVGHYHDIVLKLSQQWVNNEDDQYNTKILHDILVKCHPHEFCMKMFAGAMYANPNRSNKELCSLCDTLQDSENSLAINAKKIFKFSYRDLPREHKTCLLYLAIFHQGNNIRRSTLIGRWLTEGLITKEDWSTAVRHAERCFDALIDRCLVCPGDISAKGEFKSCTVGELVHGFITKIAKKQHILDARLSHLWAHHFSIFSGLRFRASDRIDSFVTKLHNCSPQLSLLKLLDLQGCQCFDEKNNYLKAICKNVSFLKYLSLRQTNVTHLPHEINNLHDLEILDIRQTKVPEKDTRHVLLLKLRRLLAGGTDPCSPSCNGIGTPDRKKKSLCSSVCIPHKIEKMENMEVLSNVMVSPKDGNELKDIRKLWQLRKFGVVIKDNDKHLLNLLRAIGDLNECLESLSITITETRSEDTSTYGKLLQDDLYNRLVHPPKLLKSVSINGLTRRLWLLPLLAEGSNELAKVAFSGTMILKEENLKVLAFLPKLRCVRLQHNAYKDSKLTFNEEEFEHLKCLLVNGDNMTDIIFKEGAAVELERIVLCSTNVKSLCGVGHLPKLKELELKGNETLLSFSEDGGALQQNTEPVSLSKDGADTQKNTELVLNSEDGEAPQKNTVHVSPSEDGAAFQKGTEFVSPSEEGATPQNNTERNITFKKGEFQNLKFFLFEDTKMTNIIFEDGAAPELEKITLSLMTSTKSLLTLLGSLQKLKEIELKGGRSTFLSLFENAMKAKKINNVTLCGTLLSKDDLGFLAKKPNICCLVLLDNSYDESQLSFSKGEFPKLNLLVVKCSKIKNISFNDGSATNLEKIFWFFVKSDPPQDIQISGIDNVGKLKEVELNGDFVPRQLRKDIRGHKNKPVFTHNEPEHQDQAQKNEHGDEPWFRRARISYFLKKTQH